MSILRNKFALVILAAAVLAPAAAQADVWRGVTRGFQLLDYQFSGDRNILGDGWTINANAVYAGQVYDFGVADLRLGSSTNPAPSNLSASYTLRGIPAATFAWNTGGRALEYELNVNTGMQDFTAAGSILIDVSTDVNILGFYDTQVQVSNRGRFTTDGFALEDSGTLDFDMGPVDISGNIFADAVALITQPLFDATGSENPFAKFSAKATKVAALNAGVEELQARVASGELLSDEEVATLVNNTILSAMLTGESVDNSLFSDLLQTEEDAGISLSTRVANVPEPATLLLGMFGMMTIGRRRKR